MDTIKQSFVTHRITTVNQKFVQWPNVRYRNEKSIVYVYFKVNST